ncbi:MAG TPA: 6-phosphogluconolactonase [Candidatus Paceibacterota bacterium]
MGTISVKTYRRGLEKKAAQAVSILLHKYKTKPILLMVSGGSALKILNHTIADTFGSKITVTVLDERFSSDPAVNNFLQIAISEFYEQAKKNNVNFLITVPLPNEHIQDIADRWQFDIRLWLANHPGGKVVALMGMGEDGHTAGIMPYPENEWIFNELFEDENKWVVAYDALSKNQHPQRITTTTHFLKHVIDEAILFVTGEQKKEMLRRALAPDGKVHEYPVRIIHEMKQVTVFTDIILQKVDNRKKTEVNQIKAN